MRDAENAEYTKSYQKNVMAKHSAWQTYSSNIAIIQDYVKDVITSIPGIDEQYWKDNYWNHIETWFSKYDHDEYAREHSHNPHAWAWVYFVITPSVLSFCFGLFYFFSQDNPSFLNTAKVF